MEQGLELGTDFGDRICNNERDETWFGEKLKTGHVIRQWNEAWDLDKGLEQSL